MNENKDLAGPPILQMYFIFLKWKKLIIFFFLIAIIGAVIFSSPHFIPPKFRSVAIIYPPAAYSNTVLLDYDLRFGSDKDIDEHIQVLRSSIVRDSIINKFKLFTHYKIDPAGQYKMNSLYDRYDNNILIDRTKYNSISITVYDTDPVIAAGICNEIISTGDKVKSMIIKKNLLAASSSIREEFNKSLKELDELTILINGQSKNLFHLNGLDLSVKTASDFLYEKIEVRENIKKARAFKNSGLVELLYHYESKLGQLELVRMSLLQAEKKLVSKTADSYIITPAQVADKKVSPVRWLIVAASGVASLLFLFTLAFSLEKLKTFRKEVQLRI